MKYCNHIIQKRNDDVFGGNNNSLIEECVLQGIEEEFLDNQNEDFISDDNESNQNNENMDMDDNNTLPTNEVTGKVANSNSFIMYAPISRIEFHQNFTDDEYFMVKLCHICDKANVPHHIIDDIVDLMRECKINNMQIHPEKLLKQKNFLKHLEKKIISPVAQSIVVGLEEFSTNNIL